MLEKDRLNFTILPFKRVYLKLGSKCNLCCKYCHQSQANYKFNEDIIEYLAKLPLLKLLKFGGGEPLLYQDIITKILRRIDSHKIMVMMVSNGTLLDNKTIKWLNRNNIIYAVSYDGDSNLRGAVPNWYKLKKVHNFSGLSTVVTSKFNYDEFYNDVSKATQISKKNLVSYPNFIHQTIDNPNFDLVTDEAVDKYIKFVCNEMAYEYKYKKQGVSTDYLPYLRYFENEQDRAKDLISKQGVRCCNEDNVHLNANGDFMLCSYGHNIVGNIYTGIDWNKVNASIPSKCKNCSYWQVCRNKCVANITDSNCKIFQGIYEFYKNMVGEDNAK